jgi:hypothetical protein
MSNTKSTYDKEKTCNISVILAIRKKMKRE